VRYFLKHYQKMVKKGHQPFISLALTCLFFICCSTTEVHRSETTSAPSTALLTTQAQKNAAVSNEIGTFPPTLLTALREKFDVARLFAWCGIQTNGRVMWVDSEGQLRSAHFTKYPVGYRFLAPQENKPRSFETILNQQELAPIAEYLQDTDFPVRSNTLHVGECQAHCIFLQHVESRAFDDSKNTDLVSPALRVIVQKGSTVISNSIYNLEDTHPEEVLVDDINGDGTTDYLYLGGTFVQIWTLTDTCEFQVLPFIEEDAGAKYKRNFLACRGVTVEKSADGKYSIYGFTKVPFKVEYIEDRYRWDRKAKAFIKKNSVSSN
jgi:hypothetical protein